MKQCREMLILMLVAAAMILARNPSVLAHARFWAEDGAVWYAQAYNLGWLHALLVPDGGYLNLFPRLAASMALLVPLVYAPLIMNLFGFGAQLTPVLLLLSDRLETAIPSKRLRLLIAFLYVAVPNSWEINVTVTNAQWHLAIAALFILLAEQPVRPGWKAFDYALLPLAALTGPYAAMMAPIAAYRWARDKSPYRLWALAIVIASGCVQGLVLLTASGRLHSPLGATLGGLTRIVGGQIFAAATVGATGLASIDQAGWWVSSHGSALVVAAGALLVLYAAWIGNESLRLALLYAVLQLIGALISPLVSATQPQWPLMALANVAARYFVLPILVWYSALIVIVTRGHAAVRPVAGALFVGALLIAVPADWSYLTLPNTGFAGNAIHFAQVPIGTVVTIPISPQGWTMQLTKH